MNELKNPGNTEPASKSIEKRLTGELQEKFSALHDDTFNDPVEFLSILRKNYNSLSHGHERLELKDLQVDALDNSFSPKLRLASSIAAEHFDELRMMDRARFKYGQLDSGLDSKSIRFIDDMANHNIVGLAVQREASKLLNAGTAVGTAILFGSASNVILSQALVAGSLTGGEILATAFGVAAGGIAVGSLGAVGYFGYKSFIGYGQFKTESDTDTQEISQWLKPTKPTAFDHIKQSNEDLDDSYAVY